MVVTMDGKEVNSKYAVLEDENGIVRKTWLPSIIERELSQLSLTKRDVYIRSYGLRSNKAGSRKYYDFEIVKKN